MWKWLVKSIKTFILKYQYNITDIDLKNHTADYRFYSTPSPAPASSTLWWRTSMTKEVIRWLRNTRVSLVREEHQVPILKELFRKMARSGTRQGQGTGGSWWWSCPLWLGSRDNWMPAEVERSNCSGRGGGAERRELGGRWRGSWHGTGRKTDSPNPATWDAGH